GWGVDRRAKGQVMKFKLVVARAAIGCALGTAGIRLPSGLATAAPCTPAAGVQCGPGGPGGPPPQRGPEGPPQRGPDGPQNNDFRGQGGPGGPDFRGQGGPGGP